MHILVTFMREYLLTVDSFKTLELVAAQSSNAFTIAVESLDVAGQPQGLKLRLPQLPAPFYFEGIRYHVNAISNYDSGTGKAVLYPDPGSNSSNGYNKAGSSGDPGHDDNDIIQDLFLQTAGNRSNIR